LGTTRISLADFREHAIANIQEHDKEIATAVHNWEVAHSLHFELDGNRFIELEVRGSF
jgi:hypothetical protein